MADRINTPFTNEHFANWCQKMVGQPYWYGTCVYKATNSLLSRKSNQYPFLLCFQPHVPLQAGHRQ